MDQFLKESSKIIYLLFNLWFFVFSVPEKRSNFLKRIFLSDLNVQSLQSFSLNLAILSNLALTKFSLSKLNSIEPKNVWEHSNLILVHYTILPPSLAILYLLIYYAKHKSLRKAFVNDFIKLNWVWSFKTNLINCE